jgi:hypothetical protein
LRTMAQVRRPSVLSVIRHRQDPLNSLPHSRWRN